MASNIREAISLHLEGEDLAELGLSQDPTIIATMELERCRLMPRLRTLSGDELLRIFSLFGFAAFSQRGSHVKLRRKLGDGSRQALTIEMHREIDKGTGLRFALGEKGGDDSLGFGRGKDLPQRR